MAGVLTASDFVSNEEGYMIKFPEACSACRVHLLIAALLRRRPASQLFRQDQ